MLGPIAIGGAVSAEEDEEAGAARINFEFHAASGDLGEERQIVTQPIRTRAFFGHPSKLLGEEGRRASYN